MNYASIRYMDVSNGLGVGVALFVQGCDLNPHCKNCFNQNTWSFDDGKKFTEATLATLFSFINKPYITRFTLIGGEPLADNNIGTVLNIIKDVKVNFPDKKVWIYTGRVFESIINDSSDAGEKRLKAISMADVLVDGRFNPDLKDANLHFRGSSNQRLIDVQKTMKDPSHKIHVLSIE